MDSEKVMVYFIKYVIIVNQFDPVRRCFIVDCEEIKTTGALMELINKEIKETDLQFENDSFYVDDFKKV